MFGRIKFFLMMQFFSFWGLFAPRKAAFTLIEVVTKACREIHHERTAQAMGIKKVK